MKSGSYLIGVIGAEVSSIEQRQILSGIIARAQQHHAQTVVLSNCSNPNVPEKADCTENRIYDLIASEAFDALILLSESFTNPVLRARLCDQMMQRLHLPVLLVGTALPEFDAALFPKINTSDEDDLEAMTDHLIGVCGCRRIALLTGPLSLEVSHIRIRGYRKSLEKHGISYDASLVIEGDFWYHSGRRLAEEYLSGKREEPDALLCANDYMAFGLLDAFSAAGEDITRHFAVLGYEFIPERNLHTPLLATYQRNRQALGEAAAEILMRQLLHAPAEPFCPPQGRLIAGQTCPGGSAHVQQHDELAYARMHMQYAEWNLRSEMDSRLTECRSIEQYAEIMGEFLFIVRDAVDVVLCLFEDWFSPSGSAEKTLLCRNTNHWADQTVFFVPQTMLPGIIRRYKKATVGYLNPIFFRERLLGYCMAWYDKPDTYDETYLHWLKSVSNGLEFLRLKGDVRYLLQCSTLSPSYDSMTGVFSAAGLRDAYQLMLNAQQPQRVTAIMLRFRFGQNALNTTVSAKETVGSLLAAVGVMKRFHGKGGILGRISEFAFLLLYPGDSHAALLADAVYSEITGDADFLRYADSVQCRMQFDAVSPAQCGFDAIVRQLADALDAAQQAQDSLARLPHYHELQALHDGLLRQPQAEERLQDAAGALGLNPNHFNRIYRQFFGVSFHQDQIRARLLPAKHLLLFTDDTAVSVAECCGYTDSKYFTRQFSAETGCTPKTYRHILREYLT